jgi:hypothetical protein
VLVLVADLIHPDPDPINVLQTPLQVEVNHQVITRARNGTLPIPNLPKFEKIAYVGHSYGSILGNSLNMKCKPSRSLIHLMPAFIVLQANKYLPCNRPR